MSQDLDIQKNNMQSLTICDRRELDLEAGDEAGQYERGQAQRDETRQHRARNMSVNHRVVRGVKLTSMSSRWIQTS